MQIVDTYSVRNVELLLRQLPLRTVLRLNLSILCPAFVRAAVSTIRSRPERECSNL